MKINHNELIGNKFGTLVVTGIGRSSEKSKFIIVKCMFHPEEEFEVRCSDLIRNHVTKCHKCRENKLFFSPKNLGLKKEYNKFKDMIKHAKNNNVLIDSKYNPNIGNKNYLKSFHNFYLDMVKKNIFPLKSTITSKDFLSRIDMTKGYFKNNLQLVKIKDVNRNNTKSNVVLDKDSVKTIKSERTILSMSASEISRMYNLSFYAIEKVIYNKTWIDV